MNLLAVDDDVTLCRLLKRAMERRGFAVTIAHSVSHALREADRVPPDCALVDLNMPGPTGMWLIPALKERFPALRIMVLTARNCPETAALAMRLGAAGYLTKPITAREIAAAFARCDTGPRPDIGGDADNGADRQGTVPR